MIVEEILSKRSSSKYQEKGFKITLFHWVALQNDDCFCTVWF